MADVLTTGAKANFTWDFEESLDLGTVKDESILEFSKTWGDYDGSPPHDNEADKIWHDQSTITGTADDPWDLTALTNTMWGSTITISFATVKGIFIIRTDTDATATLYLDSSYANSILGPFNGSATSKIEIEPDSCVVMMNRISGWTVTATTADIFAVRCTSTSSATYKIAIFGTST